MNKEHKHNKDLGFQVPQDFFKDFEEHMMTQVNLDEKLGKKTGFEVPEGYFESLEEKLLPREETPVKQLPKNQGLKTYLYPLLAVAAVIAVILSLTNNSGEQLSIASVETTELEEFLMDQTSLYDESTVDLIVEEHDILDDMTFSESVDTQGLYEYLENDIELNEIITE